MYSIKEIYKTIQGEGAKRAEPQCLLDSQAVIYGLGVSSIDRLRSASFVIQISWAQMASMAGRMLPKI